MKQPQSNFSSRQCKIAIKVAQNYNFQSLMFKVWALKPYWEPKAPSRAHRPQGARRALSPSQELEGRACSALNFQYFIKMFLTLSSSLQYNVYSTLLAMNIITFIMAFVFFSSLSSLAIQIFVRVALASTLIETPTNIFMVSYTRSNINVAT